MSKGYFKPRVFLNTFDPFQLFSTFSPGVSTLIKPMLKSRRDTYI